VTTRQLTSPRMWLSTWAVPFVLSLVCSAASPATEKEPERTGGPYVPTPQIVVDQMLNLANVGPRDFVVDLGSGDGVIVLTAARQLNARGYGVDIDPVLVKQSNDEAKRLGLDGRVAFYVQDVFKADLSKASVITLYLLPSMMISLRSKIFAEARPGTRVVSHDYSFDDWHPDDQVVLDVPEKEKINGVPKATLLLWIVPAKVAGRWQIEVDGGQRHELTLRQTYQSLTGSATVGDGRTAKISDAELRGNEIDFSVTDGRARHQFHGIVQGESIQGTVTLSGGRAARWTAKKI
jgi:methyltransferase family protein